MKIVITGGSRGIGKAIAEKFVANNFDVAYCSRKKESLEALQQNLQLQYPNQKIFAFTFLDYTSFLVYQTVTNIRYVNSTLKP